MAYVMGELELVRRVTNKDKEGMTGRFWEGCEVRSTYTEILPILGDIGEVSL
jgi:hypothetical protein